MSDGAHEGWAVLELLGHLVLAGHVREVPLAGLPVLRIDLTLPGGAAKTQYYPHHAIYAVTPTTAEDAAQRAERNEDQLEGKDLLDDDEQARRRARQAKWERAWVGDLED